MTKDASVLRELARQVVEIGNSPRHEQNRQLWKRHNSLATGPIPIHVRPYLCIDEIIEPASLLCENPALRRYEQLLRLSVFHDGIGDDTVIEPFIKVRAVSRPDLYHRFGFPLVFGEELDTSKFKFDPPVKSRDDIAKLTMPRHEIDWEKTRLEADTLRDALGDVMPVVVDSAPLLFGSAGDISADLGFLVGHMQLLYDVRQKPELLHTLAKMLSDAILRQYEDASRAGDWRACSGFNQCMTYSNELPDPGPSEAGVPSESLWGFMASQEFTSISPAMFDEFLLQYQKPLMQKFGLVAYGCCENLTGKIELLRSIPNLRRIAVTAWADLPACAEKIGRDYVVSWRPSPAAMVCDGFDREYVLGVVSDAVDVFCQHGSLAEITLKDIKTLKGGPADLKRWVQAARQASEKGT